MPPIRFNSLEELQEVLGITSDPNFVEEKRESPPPPAAPADTPKVAPIHPAIAAVSSAVSKALSHGAGTTAVIRSGASTLVFITGNGKETQVDFLPDETFITTYESGRVTSRTAYPKLDAHGLLRLMPFTLIRLEK
jgi:hypothetical protein